MGTFFHPPVEIYNLDHRTGDVEESRERRRKECGCLKTDNPFQRFPPTGSLCCVVPLIYFGSCCIFFCQKEVALHLFWFTPSARRGSDIDAEGFWFGRGRRISILQENRGFPKWMSPCCDGLADPRRVGYLSCGSLSLTAVLFDSYQGESDHYILCLRSHLCTRPEQIENIENRMTRMTYLLWICGILCWVFRRNLFFCFKPS